MIDGITRQGPIEAKASVPTGGIPAQGAGGSFSSLLRHVTDAGRAEEAARRVEGARPEGLEEAVASFEAFFLNFLLQSMRKTVPKGGIIDLGFAGETYTGMLDQALSEEMAKAGGIGLGKLLIDQLS